MTPKEYAVAIYEFQAEIGSRAHIWTRAGYGQYGSREDALAASVYTNWPGNDRVFEVKANEFDDLLNKVKEKWQSYKAEHRARTIRSMALEIIRITAEHGECTDAALRAGTFSDAEVTELGPEACEDADKIAGGGPFKIKPIAIANAA